MTSNHQSIVISAPSGAGKSTIVGALLAKFPRLAFSISACSRPPRGQEQDGVHYYFLAPEIFKQRIAAGAFFEWEEVYSGMYYGTLNTELERLWSAGKVVVFDVDVVGGLKIKSKLAHQALAIFIQPPSISELEKRLRTRQTDSEEKIEMRLSKAANEMSHAHHFDHVVINDNLDQALEEVERLILEFIGS
ncbi:MAG: guanylate kinase [Sphingomonadales bacterium]